MTEAREPTDPIVERTLDTGARWFGIGLVIMPIVDIVDRSGMVTMLSAPQTMEMDGLGGPLLQIAFFVAVGIAGAAVMRRHRSAGRMWTFGASVVPLAAYILYGGLRLSVALGVVALAFSFVQLRLAHGAAPTR